MSISKCSAASVSASGQVSTGSTSTYHGYIVTTTTATGPINIRMGSVTGTIVDVIASGAIAGARGSLATGPQCMGGIYAEFNGGATGTIVVLYE